jgi:hypothetical protein
VERSHLFREGDFIEIGFDGVPRHVHTVINDTVAFAPPLDEKPAHGATILIWGQKPGRWDLGLKYRELVQGLNSEK